MARGDMAVAGTQAYDRIRSAAKAAKQDVQFAFQRFALERLLGRIEASPWAGRYALKGGMLMLALPGGMNRPTEDMDLSSATGVTLEELKAALEEVCAAEPAQEDGLTFVLDAKNTGILRVPSPHVTVRAKLDAELHTRYSPVRIRLVLDVSQGEGIYPGLQRIRLPQTCKGFEPPELACYPWETVVAEKLHAITMHGALNTRMKDYFDLIAISRNLDMPTERLAEAVVVAFGTSGRQIEAAPYGLTAQFAAAKEKDWRAFTGKRGLLHAPASMDEAVATVREAYLPVLRRATEIRVAPPAPGPAPF